MPGYAFRIPMSFGMNLVVYRGQYGSLISIPRFISELICCCTVKQCGTTAKSRVKSVVERVESKLYPDVHLNR